MKLTQEQIDIYKNNSKLELSINDLKKDWYFDKKLGFTTILNPTRKWCINLKTNNECWLRMDFNDLTHEQIESLLIQPCYINEEELDELANNSADEYMYNNEYLVHNWDMFYINGFKTGYRKAMEEQIC